VRDALWNHYYMPSGIFLLLRVTVKCHSVRGTAVILMTLNEKGIRGGRRGCHRVAQSSSAKSVPWNERTSSGRRPPADGRQMSRESHETPVSDSASETGVRMNGIAQKNRDARAMGGRGRVAGSSRLSSRERGREREQTRGGQVMLTFTNQFNL
jgi:hypothetical protein